VARYLNMHAQAGVPRERLGAALVLHGAGVHIVLCGQTAGSRGFAKDELAAPVQMALSAMTANKLFQDEGYQIVAF